MADQHVDGRISAAVRCISHAIPLEDGAGARIGMHMSKHRHVYLESIQYPSVRMTRSKQPTSVPLI